MDPKKFIHTTVDFPQPSALFNHKYCILQNFSYKGACFECDEFCQYIEKTLEKREENAELRLACDSVTANLAKEATPLRVDGPSRRKTPVPDKSNISPSVHTITIGGAVCSVSKIPKMLVTLVEVSKSGKGVRCAAREFKSFRKWMKDHEHQSIVDKFPWKDDYLSTKFKFGELLIDNISPKNNKSS